MAKRVILALVLVLLPFSGVTYWALEWGGVAVVETLRPDGSPRATHVWYVSHGDALWLEAGTPENAWFQDVERAPRLMLWIDGVPTPYRAEPVRDPSAHATIRRLMRESYGVRDAWVALVFDTSRSVAVRLVPSP